MLKQPNISSAEIIDTTYHAEGHMGQARTIPPGEDWEIGKFNANEGMITFVDESARRLMVSDTRANHDALFGAGYEQNGGVFTPYRNGAYPCKGLSDVSVDSGRIIMLSISRGAADSRASGIATPASAPVMAQP